MEVRSHHSSVQSPPGVLSQSQTKVLVTASQYPICSVCPHSLCLSEPISSHTSPWSLLLAMLVSLPVLECARHDFPFASSQVSVYLAPFLSLGFYSEVTSSVKASPTTLFKIATHSSSKYGILYPSYPLWVFSVALITI